MTPSRVPFILPTAVPDDAYLLDVREQDEWDGGHIAGAVHIPMAELPARLDEVPEENVVVVCRSGNRSGRVVSWMAGIGRAALNLEGGMQAWSAAGRPMVSEIGEPPEVR